MRGNHIHLPVPGLGPLEGAIMLVVWEAPEPVKVREVLQELDYERPLAYTTVMTVMDILHRKGVLARDKHGRAWRYIPALSLYDYLARHLALTEQKCQLLFEAVRHEPFDPTASIASMGGGSDSALRLRVPDDHRYRANGSSELTEATVAQKVTVELEDDLDGGPADETVRFGFGDTEYEIDLSQTNADAFRQQLAPYIEHGRKVARPQPRRGARSTVSRQHSGDIRAWAKDHGIAVSERGRIPASVVAEYEQAH